MDSEALAFVGREHQMNALRKSFDGVGAGQASVVLVRGVPGSGKSSLLQAFADEVHDRTGARVGKVACAPKAEGSFSAFRRVVRSFAEVKDGVSRARRRAGAAGKAMLAIGPEFVSLIFPPAGIVSAAGRYLLEESGVTSKGKPVQIIGYQDSDREPYSDFVQFFRSLDPETAYIVIVDDLHWADESSMALFGRLAAFLEEEQSVPILLAGTFRTHEVAANQDHPLRSILNQVARLWGDVVVDLDELDDDVRMRFTRQLVDGFAPNVLGPDFVQRLYERTEGNPLVVLEMLESMTTKGDLVANGAGDLIRSEDFDWDHVPFRFDAALTERVDKLSPDGRRVLEMAAVQGLEFSADVVATALREDISDVVSILSTELDRAYAFVDDLGPTDTDPMVFQFRFHHFEYRRFIYEQMTESTQALAHRRIADSLLRIYAGVESGIAMDLAEHLMAAGQPRKAAPWYLNAAITAADSQALADARSIGLSGLAAAERIEPADEGELRLIVGRSAHLLGDYGAAEEHLLRALSLSSQLDDARLGARAKLWLGAGSWRRNDDDDAWGYLASALTEAADVGDHETESRVMLNLGVLARRRGDAARSLIWYEKAEGIARDSGLDARTTGAINNRAFLLVSLLGNLEAGRALYAQALEIAVAAGNRSGESLYLHNLAGAASRSGDQSRAIEYSEQAISLSRSIGNRRREATAHVDSGDAYLRSEQWSRAAAEYRQVLSMSDSVEIGSRYLSRAHVGLAAALVQAGGSIDEGIAVASGAVQSHNNGGREQLENVVLTPASVLAALLAIGGQKDEALRVLEPEGQIIRSGDDPWWFRWQHALSAMVRSILTDDTEHKEAATMRIRLAASMVSAAGIVADARLLLNMLTPISLDDAFVTEVESILAAPPEQLPVGRALRTDAARLDELASRFKEATSRTRLEPFRTPIGGPDTRQRALDDLDRGQDPVFEYEPVPASFEEPLVSLLRYMDPARSIWESLLYESVEDHLDLVLATRSGNGFQLMKASTGAFGSPSNHLVREARSLLDQTVLIESEEPTESADVAAAVMETALVRMGLDAWTVTVSPGMNARMSVNFADDTVRIRSGTHFNRADLKRLLVHEIGTHVFRVENGRRQPLALLGMGLGRNAATEEGLAWYNEEQAGLDDPSTRRKYSLRVIATDLVQRHGFAHVFSELLPYTNPDEAFEITLRTKRGLTDTSVPGGYIKDHVYLEGLLRVKDAIDLNPDVYRLLMSAKVPLRMLGILVELRRDGSLVEPRFLPADLTLDL